jgi:hypothetical protein
LTVGGGDAEATRSVKRRTGQSRIIQGTRKIRAVGVPKRPPKKLRSTSYEIDKRAKKIKHE